MGPSAFGFALRRPPSDGSQGSATCRVVALAARASACGPALPMLMFIWFGIGRSLPMVGPAVLS